MGIHQDSIFVTEDAHVKLGRFGCALELSQWDADNHAHVEIPYTRPDQIGVRHNQCISPSIYTELATRAAFNQDEETRPSLGHIYRGSDAWCVGRLCYHLLSPTGEDPFENVDEVMQAMIQGVDIPHEAIPVLPDCYSPVLRALMRQVVALDRSKRITVLEVSLHLSTMLYGP